MIITKGGCTMEIQYDYNVICKSYLNLLEKIEKLENETHLSKELQKDLCVQLQQLEKTIMIQSQTK